MIQIIQNTTGPLFSEEEQAQLIGFVDNQLLKPCPVWLGTFLTKCFYGNSYSKLSIAPLVERLAMLAPNQKFNTLFLQKYPVGSEVYPHRDPYNNIDDTIILVLGEFTDATSKVDGVDYNVTRNSAIIMSCTKNNQRGPLHSVSRIETGIRYAVILNTIKAKNDPT